MKKKLGIVTIFLCFLFASNFLFAQRNLFKPSIEFAKYLSNKKLYKESNYVLNSMLNADSNSDKKDSIYFLLGNTYTAIDSFTKANECYFLVSKTSSLFNIANYKVAINFLKNNKIDSVTATLKNFDTNNITAKEYSCLINNAVAIKQKKYNNYDSIFVNNSNNILIQSVNKNIAVSYQKTIHYKHKSPFIAGALSAALPGLGKLYAGKPGEFLGSLLPLTAMFFLCKEAYKNDGAASVPFIGLATVSTIFYIGNIYGSAVSIKARNNQFYNKINNEVLVSLDFPFGK